MIPLSFYFYIMHLVYNGKIGSMGCRIEMVRKDPCRQRSWATMGSIGDSLASHKCLYIHIGVRGKERARFLDNYPRWRAWGAWQNGIRAVWQFGKITFCIYSWLSHWVRERLVSEPKVTTLEPLGMLECGNGDKFQTSRRVFLCEIGVSRRPVKKMVLKRKAEQARGSYIWTLWE